MALSYNSCVALPNRPFARTTDTGGHLPGPFVYAMFLFVYVCFGAAVLAVAMFLALIPRARPAARWFAGGIIGSYPGVFLFQLAGAPVLVGIVLLMWLLSTVAPISYPS
jgi:hypothetical protein